MVFQRWPSQMLKSNHILYRWHAVFPKIFSDQSINWADSVKMPGSFHPHKMQTLSVSDRSPSLERKKREIKWKNLSDKFGYEFILLGLDKGRTLMYSFSVQYFFSLFLRIRWIWVRIHNGSVYECVVRKTEWNRSAHNRGCAYMTAYILLLLWLYMYAICYALCSERSEYPSLFGTRTIFFPLSYITHVCASMWNTTSFKIDFAHRTNTFILLLSLSHSAFALQKNEIFNHYHITQRVLLSTFIYDISTLSIRTHSLIATNCVISRSLSLQWWWHFDSSDI